MQVFASRLAMYRVDLKIVQERLGHKMIAMIARYLRFALALSLQVLQAFLIPGSVSVQSGYQR